MKHYKSFLILVLFALCNCAIHAQEQVPDFLSHMTGFSSGRTDHIPHGVDLLFKDSVTKFIANKCVKGASFEDLKATGTDHIEQRLSKLVNAQALILLKGKYYLPCPVIIGEKRELIDRITKERVGEILPRIELILNKLKQALRDRPQFLFHIFWSWVIDQTFWMLWDQEFPDDLGPPATTWLIYPDHPYQVGTNYNSAPNHSEIAITWSFNCSDHLTPIMRSRVDLYNAGKGIRISDSLNKNLQRYGCIDENMNSRIFYYQKGDSLDNLIQVLKKDFVVALHDLYDYQTLSRTFGIPYDDLYIVLAHEMSYSIFQKLDEFGKLAFPSVLKNGDAKQECYRLTSIVIGSSSIMQYLLYGAAGVAILGGLLWLILH
jgi:hypothetical protein